MKPTSFFDNFMKIIFITLSIIFFNEGYRTLKNVYAKKKIEKSIEIEIQQKRYDYLVKLLEKKYIIDNNEKFIEEQARQWLSYTKKGEEIIYFPPKNKQHNIEDLESKNQYHLADWLDIILQQD